MKPQMAVHYAVERPRGGQTLHLAGQGGRAGPYRGHIEPRAAQLHLSHGIVFSEDRQGLRPAHFRMQRQQRGCGTLPVGLLFRLRSAGGPAVVEVLEEVLDRRARPRRALQIDVDAVRVRGYVNGMLEGDFIGVIDGEMGAVVRPKDVVTLEQGDESGTNHTAESEGTEDEQ